MTENELKKELSSMKKCDLLHIIEELMEDNIVDITDINLCHTRALESKLAAKDDIIKQADICIFESVFTDSLLMRFISVREAGRCLNLDSSSISKCCKGKIKSYKNYVFCYE